MYDSTIKTIYALKNSNKSLDEAVIEYWFKYTGVPYKYYIERDLMDIAQNVFLDYISTADNPIFEVWNLFNNMNFDCKTTCKFEGGFDQRIRNAIWMTLFLVKVKDHGKFVNGFRDI